jgi:uncharacterized membrane protein
VNKNEYLNKLDLLLESLPYEERRDIMYDYEEHFKSGIEDGKTEEDIINKLGAPEIIAGQYITTLEKASKNSNIPSDNSTVGSIVILVGLVFLDIILIPLGIAIWALLLCFFVTGIAFVFSGIVCVIVSIFKAPIPYISIPYYSIISYPILGILTSIFVISTGSLIILGTIYLYNKYIIINYKYINWNKQIFRRNKL